eukprot:jgi/Astpho2/2440/Aster-x1076
MINQIIRQPLETIHSILQHQQEGSTGANVSRAFKDLLMSPGAWDQVPLLTADNVQSLPGSSLVRYFGMVRDQLDPEYFVAAHQCTIGSWAVCSYADSLQAFDGTLQHRIGERRPVICGPVAEQSAWVAELEGLQSSPPLSCCVLAYADEDSLPLNSVVEVVGVLSNGSPEQCSVEERLSGLSIQGSAEEIVPRIHAVLVQPCHTFLASRQVLPFKSDEQLQLRAGELRLQAIKLLAVALGDDMLAAEYLLLQLVSSVYKRSEDGPMGTLLLNLSNCPIPSPGGSADGMSKFGAAVQAAVAAVMPRSLGVAMCIEQLNLRPLCPSKDPETGRLRTATLQVAEGTQVILDETCMREGQLNGTGITNLQASCAGRVLQKLADMQTVDYSFEVYQLPMHCDAPVTVLSCGSSLLRGSTAVQIPLQPTAEFGTQQQVEQHVACQDLTAVRAFLGQVRQLDFNIGSGIAKTLEQELVQARSEDKSLDAAVFHTWLTLARLQAISHGEMTLTTQRWQKMRKLEHARAERTRASKT